MDDISGLMAHPKLDKAHFVGGKSGGTIAMKYAIDQPAMAGDHRIARRAGLGERNDAPGASAPPCRLGARDTGGRGWASL